MDGLKDILGLIGGALVVLGAVVTLTRYLTQLQEKGEREKVEARTRDLEAKLRDAEARRDQLIDQIGVAGRAGGAALSQKAALDDEVRALMKSSGASGASLYVPVRSPRGEIQGLAFLCIEPFSLQTQQLRSKLIPLKSLAGQCLTSGDPFVVANAAQNAGHFRQANALTDYKLSTTLNVPLKAEGSPVGVLQLLSKEGERGFTENDLKTLTPLIRPLAQQLDALCRSGDCLQLLGVGEERGDGEGTVLYFDLSASSALFQELSASFALQLLNEYFERMCEAAFRVGGTLDTYVGDGALLRFNIPRALPEHELAAVTAALGMKRAFAEVRDYWTAISPRLAVVNLRAGVSTGPLLRANLGHSQVQSLTVLGYPISVAAALCDSGARDRSVVLVGEETYRAVADRVVAEPVPQPLSPKAGRFTSAAYEITGLR